MVWRLYVHESIEAQEQCLLTCYFAIVQLNPFVNYLGPIFIHIIIIYNILTKSVSLHFIIFLIHKYYYVSCGIYYVCKGQFLVCSVKLFLILIKGVSMHVWGSFHCIYSFLSSRRVAFLVLPKHESFHDWKVWKHCVSPITNASCSNFV